MEEDGPDGGPGEMRTELGVMGAPDATESGHSSPHSMQNYSLDDAEHPAPTPASVPASVLVPASVPAPVAVARSAPKAAAEAPPAEPEAAEATAAVPGADNGDGMEPVDLAAEAEDMKMMQGAERSA